LFIDMHRIEKTTEILDADLIEEADIRKFTRPSYGLWGLLVLMLAAVGYAAHRGWNERQRLLGEQAQAEQTLRSTQARLAALETERNQLVAEREALQKSVQAKETALAQSKEAQATLEQKVKEETAKGELALTHCGGRTRAAHTRGRTPLAAPRR